MDVGASGTPLKVAPQGFFRKINGSIDRRKVAAATVLAIAALGALAGSLALGGYHHPNGLLGALKGIGNDAIWVIAAGGVTTLVAGVALRRFHLESRALLKRKLSAESHDDGSQTDIPQRKLSVESHDDGSQTDIPQRKLSVESHDGGSQTNAPQRRPNVETHDIPLPLGWAAVRTHDGGEWYRNTVTGELVENRPI